VRIVTEKFLREAAEQYPQAARYLTAWTANVRAAAWRNTAEVRGFYGSADMAHVRNGRPVFVFHVGGNKYRLVVAMQFNKQMASTLRFLTRAEYSRENWKQEL
jgi:mRNA interferase HigB